MQNNSKLANLEQEDSLSLTPPATPRQNRLRNRHQRGQMEQLEQKIAEEKQHAQDREEKMQADFNDRLNQQNNLWAARMADYNIYYYYYYYYYYVHVSFFHLVIF